MIAAPRPRNQSRYSRRFELVFGFIRLVDLLPLGVRGSAQSHGGIRDVLPKFDVRVGGDQVVSAGEVQPLLEGDTGLILTVLTTGP